jgi:anti-sigma regulatory factor (Ser/Thr protein kinase)
MSTEPAHGGIPEPAPGGAPPRRTLELPPTLASAREAAVMADRLVFAWSKNAHEARMVALAVTEVVTNVVRHGWRGSTADAIRVDFELAGGVARISFRYPGMPFDWQVAPDAPSHALGGPALPELSELKEGGYGLYLIHAIADQVSKRCEGPLQELTLIRRMERPDGAGPATRTHEVPTDAM